ncbi:MAG: hypothetical protein AMJ53_08030 [Gammaproteobacteria bacterium SG8_11]|nr:MAG: hypothetical protein AMJ53_08030 [Gammaproteobacteria bacterium SG8_11]
MDVNRSEHDCTLESLTSEKRQTNIPAEAKSTLALRLGLRMVKGLSSAGITAVCDARRHREFASVQDLASRAKLNKSDLQSLAAANALKGLSGDRHQAFWQVAGTENGLTLFPSPEFYETDVMLHKPTEGQDIVSDYAAVGLTVGRHPLELLRQRLIKHKIATSLQLWDMPSGVLATAAGLVICRQRPGSANNVMFVTLEDELGHTNVVVWPQIAEQQKKALLKARLLAVTGTVQQEDGVLHLIAKKLEDLSAWLGQLDARSRDFQ